MFGSETKGREIVGRPEVRWLEDAENDAREMENEEIAAKCIEEERMDVCSTGDQGCYKTAETVKKTLC
jgi:hypothetical protein